MVINEWPAKWKILSIPHEVPEGPTEGEETHIETQPPQKLVPKKPRTGQNKPPLTRQGSKQT
jgi:hypothetical protein